MTRHSAPEPARDVVAFRQGMASWNFSKAIAAADRLMPLAMNQHRWISADELRDGKVVAHLNMGDAGAARKSLNSLAKFSTRAPSDLRSLLLEAYVEAAESRTINAQR
jgi:hypothetical protein